MSQTWSKAQTMFYNFLDARLFSKAILKVWCTHNWISNCIFCVSVLCPSASALALASASVLIQPFSKCPQDVHCPWVLLWLIDYPWTSSSNKCNNHPNNCFSGLNFTASYTCLRGINLSRFIAHALLSLQPKETFNRPLMPCIISRS